MSFGCGAQYNYVRFISFSYGQRRKSYVVRKDDKHSWQLVVGSSRSKKDLKESQNLKPGMPRMEKKTEV
jgi:hypothetical protein